MKKKNCESCKYWNIKASGSDGGAIGICQKQGWGVTFHFSAEILVRHFGLDPRDAELIANGGIRTAGTFLCNQYEKEL